MEAGLADYDYFDFEAAPLANASSNNVQQQSIDDEKVSTCAKQDGSQSTTRHTTSSSTSLSVHTHTSAGATNSRLSTMERSVAPPLNHGKISRWDPKRSVGLESIHK
jgi:hypothetical protein